MNSYDYVVLNETGKVAECAEKIHAIITDQQQRVENCGEFIQQMSDDLKNMNLK